MIIQIDGWFAGGKSVLWSLLDNHSKIFVNPVHDFSHSLLLSHKDSEEWLRKKHTTHLRKILAPSEYYKFEKMYIDGYLGIGYSSNDIDQFKYKIDFYKFDKLFFTNLQKLKKWDLEIIIETLYKSYYEVYSNQNLKYPKYYATMSHPGKYKEYNNIPEIFPNMKSIIVKRGLKNIIASRINRKERPKDLNEYQAFSTPFNVILQRNEIEQILEYFDTNEKLAKLFPNQFMIIEFEDLVKNTEESMKKVAKFLNIRYENILSIPTRDGIILEKDGISFIGKENDDYRKLLTDNEIKVIDERIEVFKNKKPFIKSDYTANKVKSKDFILFYNQLENIKKNYTNIAIYGYGTFGKIVYSYIKDNVSVIVDQSYNLYKDQSIKIYHPNKLKVVKFNTIVICGLGYENDIINDLILYYNVPKNNIITFDFSI